MRLVRRTYPRYFVYDERPVVLLETPDGGLDCLAADPRSGAFVRAMRYIGELDFNRDADIDELPFEEFVDAVEMYRARKGLGEGTVKELYDTIRGIDQTAREDGDRRLSAEERALIRSLSKRTNPLFEESLRERGLTGTPQPSPAGSQIARAVDRPADTPERPQEVPSPQNEHELVARLHPESPILFARARRLLRDMTPNGVGRFRVGAVEDGCWSVLHGENGWQSAGRLDGAAETSDHATAREATAHAVGGILAAEGVSVNSDLLELAGLVKRELRVELRVSVRVLTEAALRIGAESENAARPSGTSWIALADLVKGPGFFVCRPGPAPSEGPFVSVHTIFTMVALSQLPESAGEPAETLPEGTVLDGYGGTDQVFLFEPGTPFHRRGLWDEPARHPHRFYWVRRPLRVYPSFPIEYATIPVEDIPDQGRGYYLVDTIADLLASGALSETTERP